LTNFVHDLETTMNEMEKSTQHKHCDTVVENDSIRFALTVRQIRDYGCILNTKDCEKIIQHVQKKSFGRELIQQIVNDLSLKQKNIDPIQNEQEY